MLAPRGRVARAFTLIELLVTISIISLLLGLMLPLMGRALGEARAFRCKMSLRSVAFDFSLFANDELGPERGDDARGSFRLETFQESLYGISEFWRWEGVRTHTLPDGQGNDPLRCASMKGAITLERDLACSGGAIRPARNISYGFNLRLHAPAVRMPGGEVSTPIVALKSDIVQQTDVPLAWDVDGAEAESREVSPVFSAPTEPPLAYPDGRYWFPAMRHNGSLNVAFIGGHVLSSRRPLEESGWGWAFQPVR